MNVAPRSTGNEEKVRVHMNVAPRSTGNTNSGTKRINSEV